MQGSLIALMIDAVRTSETSVKIYLTTRQYIPEDSKLHNTEVEQVSNGYFKKVSGSPFFDDDYQTSKQHSEIFNKKRIVLVVHEDGINCGHKQASFSFPHDVCVGSPDVTMTGENRRTRITTCPTAILSRRK
jgi:hypothetical protein